MPRQQSTVETAVRTAGAAVAGAVGCVGLTLFAEAATTLIAFHRPGGIDPITTRVLVSGLVLLAVGGLPMAWLVWPRSEPDADFDEPAPAGEDGDPPGPADVDAYVPSPPGRGALVAGLALFGLALVQAARAALGVMDGVHASASVTASTQWMAPYVVGQLAVILLAMAAAAGTMLGGDIGRTISVGVCGFYVVDVVGALSRPMSSSIVNAHQYVGPETVFALVQGLVAVGVALTLTVPRVADAVAGRRPARSDQGL